MAGFNHTRMHWPDCNLMNLLALDGVKLIRPPIIPPVIGGADWSQPRVAFRNDPGLLEKLALEIVHGRKILGEGREAGVVFPHAGRSQPQHMLGGVSKHAPDADATLGFVLAEQRDRICGRCQLLTQCGNPGLNFQDWDERAFHDFQRSQPTPAHNKNPNSARMERNGPNRKSG
jgi:hypothetical protein